MRIFVLLIIMAISFYGEHFWCASHRKRVLDLFDILSDWFCLLGGISIIAIMVAMIVAFCNNVNDQAFIAEKQAIRTNLVYQFENNLYDNDNDLGKKELYDQIQEYNKTIASGKAWTHSPWFGIFCLTRIRPN